MRVFNILITNIPNNVNLKKIPIGFNYDLTSIKDPEIRVEFFKAVYDMADYAHTNYYDRKMRNKNPEDIESISICQTNHEIAEECHIKAIYDPLDKNGHEEISIDEEFNIIGTQTNIGDYLEGLQLEEYRKLIYAQYQRVYKDGRCNARNCVCKDSGEMIKLDDKHCFSKIMKLYSFTLCCGAIHRDCFSDTPKIRERCPDCYLRASLREDSYHMGFDRFYNPIVADKGVVCPEEELEKVYYKIDFQEKFRWELILSTYWVKGQFRKVERNYNWY